MERTRESPSAPSLEAALTQEGRVAELRARPELGPAKELLLPREDLRRAGELARELGYRLSALWAEERGEDLALGVLVAREGCYRLLRTSAPLPDPAFPSLAPVYPAADRLERHAADLLGARFEGHPDPRRWTRHQAWPASSHPLRSTHPAGGDAPPRPTPPDSGYPFDTVAGAGVFEIPVGPVHAGIIEPGHFRFHALGERILHLEERLGYVHKGIEKAGAGRRPDELARLACRVSGDSAVAHAWAACMAMERAGGAEPPARALALRAILAECERVVNHLWDIAAVSNDIAFAFAYYQLGRLVEDWRRLHGELFGSRLLMDTIVPGGVACDLDSSAIGRLRGQCRHTREALERVWEILQGNASVHDRLDGTGVLAPADALELGAVGFVARASGQDLDARRDAPYPPYDRLELTVPSVPWGDVAARVRIRHDELLLSLEMVDALAGQLPGGPIRGELPTPAPDRQGLGIVEGWRGETVAAVRFGEDGRISRYFPRDPSWLTWPALERLIHGNIVPDFPVCNKSINASYSGVDL